MSLRVIQAARRLRAAYEQSLEMGLRPSLTFASAEYAALQELIQALEDLDRAAGSK